MRVFFFVRYSTRFAYKCLNDLLFKCGINNENLELMNSEMETPSNEQINMDDRTKILRLDAFRNRNESQPSCNQRAKALATLAVLVEYRDTWNAADGYHSGYYHHWPDTKWCIEIDRENVNLSSSTNGHGILYFASRDTRDRFYNTFHQQINMLRLLF